MAQLMAAGGLALDRVIIHAIEDNTFRAVLKLTNAAEEALELDARPSDAIALALRTGSSIWMLEEVVVDASIPVDAEADAVDQEDFRRFLDNTTPAALIRHLRQTSKDDPAPSESAASEEDPDTDLPSDAGST
jgi:bifunctional DNase/RNase